MAQTFRLLNNKHINSNVNINITINININITININININNIITIPNYIEQIKHKQKTRMGQQRVGPQSEEIKKLGIQEQVAKGKEG